ncbi:MAG: energy transducer TonB [Desulfobacteraceae bacterium]
MGDTTPETATSPPPEKSSRSIQVMLLISLAVHILLFLYLSGVYRSDAVTPIELTMRNETKPFSRSIPRPRQRSTAPQIHDTQKTAVPNRQVPKIETEPKVAKPVAPVTETVAVPDVSGIRPAKPSQIGFEPAGSPVFATKGDYFQMVRMRIETRKTYPAKARKNQIQGRVSVVFTITADGGVGRVSIAKSSGHDILDAAALSAVESASPLPRPPGNLFDDRIQVQITIMFELT